MAELSRRFPSAYRDFFFPGIRGGRNENFRMRSAECGLYLGYSRIARIGSVHLAASYAVLRIAETPLDRMNRINWVF
jgi:hypothetical protein